LLRFSLENPENYTIMRVTFPTIPPEQRFAWGIPPSFAVWVYFLLISFERGEGMNKDDLRIPKYLPFLAVFAGLFVILLIELLTRWFSG